MRHEKLDSRNFPSILSEKEEKAANPTLGKDTSAQFVQTTISAS